MPRRAAAQVRPVEPDPVHRNRLVQQVINKVMLDGKKSVAEQIVYDALAILGERTGKNSVEQLEAGIKALTPMLEVRSRRVGGATYQVPVEVPARRSRTLAVRWLVLFARQRREKTMSQRLAHELLDATHSRAARTSARTTFTAWRRPTRPSPTIAGSRGASVAPFRGRAFVYLGRERLPRVPQVPPEAASTCAAYPAPLASLDSERPAGANRMRLSGGALGGRARVRPPKLCAV